MPVTRLSLGTAQLGMPYGLAGGRAEMPSDRHASSMLHAAYDLGIASLDTSPEYGHAEQRVGAFLTDHDLHEEIAICTRLPSLAACDTRRVAQQVEDALTASLRRLQSDIVDTYLIRDAADLERHGQALIDALCHQRDKGRALSIGVSVASPAELALVEEHPDLGVVRHPFSLLDRRLLEGAWPERLAASGTRLQVRSALARGLLAIQAQALTGDLAQARPQLAQLEQVLAGFGLTPASAALPFALAVDPDSVVVGAETIEQLEALVATASTPLPEDLLAVVEREVPATPPPLIAALYA